eukprot:scaffold2048_cov204-Alexandrium_tamarense.AAC.45
MIRDEDLCVPLPSVYVSCSRRHRQRALYIVRYSWAADGYYPTASPSEPEPIVTPALTKTGGKEHRVARSTSDTTSIYPKTVLPYRRGARRGIANCANDEVYLRYQAVSKRESNLHSLLLKQASNATNTNQFCTSSVMMSELQQSHTQKGAIVLFGKQFALKIS